MVALQVPSVLHVWSRNNKSQTGTMPAATRLVPFLCHVPKLAARAPLPAVLRARTRFPPARVPARLRVVQHWRVRRSSSSSSSSTVCSRGCHEPLTLIALA
mmetsp:Transcript_4014/g.7487  ORF Transcript_4014/g.7487 Transcript_4014/m.7487 type:complete len:101 (-) Transcript_4014:320-622(-)